MPEKMSIDSEIGVLLTLSLIIMSRVFIGASI